MEIQFTFKMYLTYKECRMPIFQMILKRKK